MGIMVYSLLWVVLFLRVPCSCKYTLRNRKTYGGPYPLPNPRYRLEVPAYPKPDIDHCAQALGFLRRNVRFMIQCETRLCRRAHFFVGTACQFLPVTMRQA